MIRNFVLTVFLAGAASMTATASARDGDAVAAGLRPAVHVAGTPEVRWTVAQRLAAHGVSGTSVAVLRDGKVAWAHGYGVRQAGKSDAVTAETMFSVGSLSKVGTAAVVLRLVDEGRLDLDRDLNDYLKRWKIPASPLAQGRAVTLRRLLSHTAGINVHGFPDYLPGAALPTILDTLDGRPPSQTEAVRMVYTPGTQFRYSGGGVTIEQLVVEDVLGVDFETAAKRYLFDPLDMKRSTYRQPLDPAFGNIAMAHDAKGKPTALPRGYEAMPETAASGLWTTPSDYARMVAAFIASYRGAPGAFLSRALAEQMMTEVAPGTVGLGPFVEGRGRMRRFHHGGSNNSYRAWMEGNLASGNGVVIFTNGSDGDDLYPEIRRAVAASEGWPDSGVADVPAVTLSAARLTELEGRYRLQPTGVLGERMRILTVTPIVRVSLADGVLKIGGESGGGSALVPADRSNFVYSNDAERWVEFVSGGGDGKIERIVLRNGLSAIEAIREP
jgi:CubicO group peptidase (beta-lactamase class C family)